MADDKKKGLFGRLFKGKRREVEEAAEHAKAFDPSTGRTESNEPQDPSVLDITPRQFEAEPQSPSSADVHAPDRREDARSERRSLAARLKRTASEPDRPDDKSRPDEKPVEEAFAPSSEDEHASSIETSVQLQSSNWRVLFGDEKDQHKLDELNDAETEASDELVQSVADDQLSGAELLPAQKDEEARPVGQIDVDTDTAVDTDTGTAADADTDTDTDIGEKGDAERPDERDQESRAVEADDARGDGDQDVGVNVAETDVEDPEVGDEETTTSKSWFRRLREGLARTSSSLAGNIGAIFTKRKLDDETLEELEDALIQADLGIDVAMQVTEALAKGRYNKEISSEEVKDVLSSEIQSILEPVALPLVLPDSRQLQVLLLVGVNGSGKTTTIGKLAQKYTREGKKVMLAAGDTFRAAAIEQLKIWGERTGSPVVARDTGADAAGLAFDAMKDAKEAGIDVLLIDTAGRLQNKAELMAELEKIVRVIKKHDPDAPHHVILTLDATTGQNALAQADVFGKAVGVTGLVMTKLDGTARGGILVAIAQRYELPVHFIGVGEAADDLQPFTARDFADAIAGLNAE